MSIFRPRRNSTPEGTAGSQPDKSNGRVSQRRAARKERAEERANARANKLTALDQGLTQLNQRLGITATKQTHSVAAALQVDPTEHLARSIYYSPDLDGYAEPGEVVWVTVPSSPPQERSMLVIGRNMQNVLGLLISSHKGHANKSEWLEIGNGEWDTNAEQCWLRLDKTIVVPETQVSRRGILFPRSRFEVVANRLRATFRWA
ncbi:type II toxin-antitoxin system PemK/MazF family toxin [Corynebacterium lubricantis]|uniref:type II toxin-antitoxin system PemK/MazF family toxin n=1 Tax=Corynebacterium lubricantis TaxID=541095 RepID=UPI00037AB598|nr:type II toxin-antitoxin system PemK/MazF family toxin [Corynebacterium lubricantis]